MPVGRQAGFPAQSQPAPPWARVHFVVLDESKPCLRENSKDKYRNVRQFEMYPLLIVNLSQN